MKICIFGAASPLIEQKYTEAAFTVAKALAQAGHSMVFGGGGTGMMGAAAIGFQEGHGHVTGILPAFFRNTMQEILFEECDEIIYTINISERIHLMEEMSDAFLVLPGGIGTYEEFFKVYVSIALEQHRKKLMILNVDGYFDPLMAMLKDGAAKKMIAEKRLEMFRVFRPEELDELLEYLK